jgi:hypothetical protein
MVQVYDFLGTIQSKQFDDDDDNDHVDGMRLRPWTEATNGTIVYPPGDIWARRNNDGMIARENSWFVIQSSLAILPARIIK